MQGNLLGLAQSAPPSATATTALAAPRLWGGERPVATAIVWIAPRRRRLYIPRLHPPSDRSRRLRSVDVHSLQQGQRLAHRPLQLGVTGRQQEVGATERCKLHIKWPFFNRNSSFFRGNSPSFLDFQLKAEETSGHLMCNLIRSGGATTTTPGVAPRFSSCILHIQIII